MGILIKSPETEKEWEDYFDLRYRILRKPLGKARGTERDEGDSFALHFALYMDDALLAVARLDNSGYEKAQVRFVAVDDSVHGKGYGRKIMQATEIAAKEHGSSSMILHARDYAVEFYLRLGYSVISPSHKLFGVLQHFLMEKKL
jgi:predicted GNAT family N-acyltransferase